MEMYDVVTKLVGHIQPVGSHNQDLEGLENLKELTKLIDELLEDIRIVARCADNHQNSMMRCGKYAKEFLEGLKYG